MSLNDLPIKRKLVAFVLIITLSVLILSYLILLSYETRTYRETVRHSLATLADIISSNSTAALMYDDPKLAREILSGLRAEPDVVEAALFDKKGRLYSTYQTSADPVAFPMSPAPDGIRFGWQALTLYEPVIQGQTRVGTLYLKSDLSGMHVRLAVYGLILLSMLAGSGVLAFLLSNRLLRQISEPILSLTNTAKVISEHKDYRVRARKTSTDELGYLTDAFNGMLDEIERHHAVLEESEQRFRAVADSAPVLIWLANPDKQITWFNKSWLAFTGRSLAEEIAGHWTDTIHPDDREECGRIYAAAFDARREFRMEYRRRRADGEYRWLLVHGVPRFQGGKFVGYIGSCVEIHDRKVAEAALRESEMQMRLITDRASVFLCQLDRDHRFKVVNPAYASRYGRRPQEFVGRHVSEFSTPAVYAVTRKHIESTLEGHREEFELEMPYPTLGLRWVHIVYMPAREVSGRVMGLVAVITDLTERRQTEKELERARDEAVAASRAKDDFLAALSHELRTPLSPVLLLASDGAGNTALPPEIRTDFETIRKNVELEARLIDDLLDITRITRDRLNLDLSVFDLHTVLRDALTTVRAELDRKRIELILTLHPDPLDVRGDAVRLQQVFWNILKNAVKFTPEAGRITIATAHSSEPPELCVRITDTGIGMTPQEIDRVFAAFSQGDHAAGGGSHRFGGLGLGLAISQKVVELHAGRISVVSEGRNHGCTFSIALPPAAATQNHLSPVAAHASAGRFPSGETDHARPAELTARPFDPAPAPRCVLLVEDHAPTRAAMERLLRRRRYRVLLAVSVAEARRAAAREKIDLVISDIGLPDGSGYALMAELQERHQIPGIALSGYGMEDDIAQSQAAGFAVHLIKPVGIQALDKALAIVARDFRAG
jgi:PAS domain S-box-containing protein